MNQLQIFENSEFGQIRTLEENGKALFSGTDVARVLGYANPWDALKRHCLADGVVKREGVSETTNQHGATSQQVSEMTFITEGNVYRLITHSKLPSAEKFERWVFDEVLPSIRKHGVYATPQSIEEMLSDPETMIKTLTALKEEREKRQALEVKAEQDKPKVLFADAVSVARTTILVGELAKLLKQNGVDIGQNRLFQWLRENGYLIKRKGTDFNSPTQRSMEMGLFEVKEMVIAHSHGNTTISKTTKVTGKGQQYFVNIFLNKNESEAVQ